MAALDEAARFGRAHEVQACLGLVPSEYSTGGQRRMGGITRCGNAMVRRLLIQAASSLLRTRAGQEDPLVVWATELAARWGALFPLDADVAQVDLNLAEVRMLLGMESLCLQAHRHAVGGMVVLAPAADEEAWVIVEVAYGV